MNQDDINTMLQGCMEAAKLLHYTKDIRTMQDADIIANTIFAECYSTMEEAVRIISKKCGKWTIFEDYDEIDGKALSQFKLHMEKYPLTPIPEVVGGWYVQPNDTFEESLTINGLKQLLYDSCCFVIDCVERASNGAEQLQTEETQPFPTELDNEQAKKYFARAVEAGLMNEQYEWRASKALLSCFCQEMSNKLCLGKGYDSNWQQRISWKPFEKLFGYSNLRASLNDIKKTGQDPIGIEKINAIFQE